MRVLGPICIGMQLLYDESEENPGRRGLGILPGVVRRLPKGVKHPQMQWNAIDVKRETHLLAGLEPRIGVHTPGVDANLAGAQQLLQMTVGDIREVDAEPAVEAHAGLVARHLDGFYGRAHVSSQRVSDIPA